MRNAPTGCLALSLTSSSENLGCGFGTQSTPRFLLSWLQVASTQALWPPSKLYAISILPPTAAAPPADWKRAFAAAGLNVHASPQVLSRKPGTIGETKERSDFCESWKMV